MEEARKIMKDYEYADAKSMNRYLKSLKSDELRLSIISKITDGICIHCGEVTDRCFCMADD